MSSFSIHDYVFSLSFKKNTFLSAAGGSLVFGPVFLDGGLLNYVEKEQFCLHHTKLPEFLSTLKQLATNIVTAGDEKPTSFESMVEVATEERIKMEGKNLVKIHKNERMSELAFDQFIFCDFMTALCQVTIFVTNPSPLQYTLACLFQENKLENPEESMTQVIEKCFTHHEDMNVNKKLLLTQYLNCHIHILNFIYETNKLSGLRTV